MMRKFKEMLMEKAKKGKFLDKKDLEAKKEVLGEMKEMLQGLIGDDLKKVTVASPTSEGLKAGLEKAKEVVEKKGEMEDEEGYDQEMEEDKDPKSRIAELEAELAKLKGEGNPCPSDY